jgi:hypothetical protein
MNEDVNINVIGINVRNAELCGACLCCIVVNNKRVARVASYYTCFDFVIIKAA